MQKKGSFEFEILRQLCSWSSREMSYMLPHLDSGWAVDQVCSILLRFFPFPFLLFTPLSRSFARFVLFLLCLFAGCCFLSSFLCLLRFFLSLLLLFLLRFPCCFVFLLSLDSLSVWSFAFFAIFSFVMSFCVCSLIFFFVRQY